MLKLLNLLNLDLLNGVLRLGLASLLSQSSKSLNLSNEVNGVRGVLNEVRPTFNGVGGADFSLSVHFPLIFFYFLIK